jgi:hypothetical protein
MDAPGQAPAPWKREHRALVRGAAWFEDRAVLLDRLL